ncbi:methionine aminopeptidase, merops subfamily M24 [Linderina pennispora]|uniref:Methionine aminopeptidase n=1 Tax=Linderina pennispora TaxID=61395 RepID=A0A1Y1WFC8_9FUNG|nr:methionine aminopeptidase, merops subfamily M24 [Linderina pennispora]ORX72105.1 methionine aminopeptidase, merops subfamily M24 [Linderina pennispora]
MSASGPFRHLARSFTTSATAHQPRHSLRSLASSLSSKHVPEQIPRPQYAATGTPPAWPYKIPILSAVEIERLRHASVIARDALRLGGSLVKPGVTTEEIDRRVHEYIISQGAYPSCLNYMGFPKAICTSVNNVIAHGIPDTRPLQDGDFINLDVTVYKDGFHGDNSAMFSVGTVDKQGRDLMDITKESLDLAIQACGPGVRFASIGETISSLVEPLGYTVSQELTGHGVGREFHQNPLIYHHWNEEPGTMEPGMAFTIEPIVCQGVATGVMWPDGWTIATQDGGRSAQYEHTLVVTSHGVDVLTS